MAELKKGFTLREKKYAKTKIALMMEFMNRLKMTRFADISIKEVCEAVEVSEGTFYNYFPRKGEVIEYYFALTFLRIVWILETDKAALNYQEKIEYVFEAMSNEIKEPFLFYEIISVKTSEKKDCDKNLDLTNAEKVFGVPGCPGIEKVQPINMEGYFSKVLKEAQKKGQLQTDFSVEQIVMALISTAIGIPLSVYIKDFGKLKKMYKTQLAMLRDGLSPKKRK